MRPLGYNLRPEDDIDLARADRSKGLLMAERPAQIVARQNRHPRLGKNLRHFFRDPLHPRPAGDQRIFCTAGWARLWHRRGIAAMMADKFAAKAMLNQPGRALRTFDPMPAGPA